MRSDDDQEGGGLSRRRDRNPLLWLAPIPRAAALWLGSRHDAGYLPLSVAASAGDMLWATAAILGIGLLSPEASYRRGRF